MIGLWSRRATLAIALAALLGLPARQILSSPPSLSGTFIQFQKSMMKLKARDWDRELSAMQTLGVRRIVLQWTAYDAERFIPGFPLARDPVKSILKAAESYGMHVYLGLYFDSRWWKSWNDETFQKETIAKSAKLAQTLARRYGKSEAFAGWYLPFEASDGDFTWESQKKIRDFFAALSRDAKLAAEKPVLASVFFKARYAPEDSAPVFQGILEGAGVDVLLVQDGVGANGWEDDIETMVVPFLDMFQTLTKKLGMEMWVIPEIFAEKDLPSTDPEEAPPKTERVPSDAQRIEKQMRFESSYGDLVAFDVFHYASPFRNPKARRLYDELLTLGGGDRRPLQKDKP